MLLPTASCCIWSQRCTSSDGSRPLITGMSSGRQSRILARSASWRLVNRRSPLSIFEIADSPIGGAIIRPSCACVRPRLRRKSLKLFGKTISALALIAASERRIENFSIFVKLTTEEYRAIRSKFAWFRSCGSRLIRGQLPLFWHCPDGTGTDKHVSGAVDECVAEGRQGQGPWTRTGGLGSGDRHRQPLSLLHRSVDPLPARTF